MRVRRRLGCHRLRRYPFFCRGSHARVVCGPRRTQEPGIDGILEHTLGIGNLLTTVKVPPGSSLVLGRCSSIAGLKSLYGAQRYAEEHDALLMLVWRMGWLGYEAVASRMLSSCPIYFLKDFCDSSHTRFVLIRPVYRVNLHRVQRVP